MASSCLRSNGAGHRFLGDVSDSGLRAGRTLLPALPQLRSGHSQTAPRPGVEPGEPRRSGLLWDSTVPPGRPFLDASVGRSSTPGKRLSEYTSGFDWINKLWVRHRSAPK